MKALPILILIILFTNCNNDELIESDHINEWTKKANIPNDYLRLSANVITYNNEAYLLPGKGGTRFSSKPEIIKYSNNEWTQIVTYDGFANAGNSKSIINNDVIYILGGVNSSNAPTDEVRAFSITDTTFSNETRFPLKTNIAYTETEAFFGDHEEFVSYNFNSQITESLPLISINQSVSSAKTTTENNTIYVFFDFLESNNFFAFDVNSKKWIQLPDFPGGSRSQASIISTKTDIYAGLGSNQTLFFDIWKYNIETNKWIEFAEYPGKHFSAGFSFELNNELFFGGGFTGGGSISNDVLNEDVYSIKVE